MRIEWGNARGTPDAGPGTEVASSPLALSRIGPQEAQSTDVGRVPLRLPLGTVPYMAFTLN